MLLWGWPTICDGISGLVRSSINKVSCSFFSIRVFFHKHWRLTEQQVKGGDHLLFHSTTSTRSWTFRHLFATLHVRRLSHTFNCNTCIYQTAIWWDLPPYQITIRLIDVTLVFFDCLCDDLILAFLLLQVRWETSGLELLSIITLVLQANRLTKCASHPKSAQVCSSWQASKNLEGTRKRPSKN